MNFEEMNWAALAEVSRDTPVVLPVAALEQHGRHMPVFTDSLLCGEVIRRVKTRYASSVLFTPLLWLGNSDHHLDFDGTLSAPPRVYLDLLGGLIDNLVMHGFRRIMFVNGHGGNDVPGRQAVFEARQRYRTRADLMLLFSTYWLLGGEPYKIDRSLVQTQMGHACEWETSMMLRIRPELVGPLANLSSASFGNAFEPATRGWVTKDRTAEGHIGEPGLATAEKGESLFRVFADDVSKLLDRVLAWDGSSWDG